MYKRSIKSGKFAFKEAPADLATAKILVASEKSDAH
jgi:hypothetical protein